jgi:hypothetical protein
MLSQDVEVGNHLGQIYEKLGKKEDAIHSYRLAYATTQLSRRIGGPDKNLQEVEQRYQQLTGKPLSEPEFPALKTRGRPGPPGGESWAGELSKMRDVRLTSTSHPTASGTFTIVFSPGKIDEVMQVDGDQSLKSLSERIQNAKFGVEFPDNAPVKLRRRGIVSCGGLGCDMTLLPINDRSLFAEQ